MYVCMYVYLYILLYIYICCMHVTGAAYSKDDKLGGKHIRSARLAIFPC
jgi:hypothetical protein